MRGSGGGMGENRYRGPWLRGGPGPDPGRRRRLFVSGWTGALGPLPYGATVLAPLRVRDALNVKESVLLLGPGAVGFLEPATVERKLRSSTCICIAVSTPSDLEALTRWRYVGKVPVCTPAGLPARLEDAMATPVRREIPRSAWAPWGGSEGKRLLAVIPRLSSPRPGDLARALGMERHFLVARCRKEFGLEPRALLKRYRRAYARLGRAKGHLWMRLAIELGYATVKSLQKSIL